MKIMKNNLKELLDSFNVGLVTYSIYLNEFKCHFDLPDIPKDYFLPVAGIDVITDDDCKFVLNALKNQLKDIDTRYTQEEKDADYKPYNDELFFISLFAGQMFDLWFGKHKFIWKDGNIGNNEIECYVDIFLFDFWKYLEGKKSYVGMKRSANDLYKHYSKLYLS